MPQYVGGRKKKRRPVFSGTGTPACALTTSQSRQSRGRRSLQPRHSSQSVCLLCPSTSVAAKKNAAQFSVAQALLPVLQRPPAQIRSRVHLSLQSFQSSLSLCSPCLVAAVAPQKKTPPNFIWRRVQIPRLACLLSSHPPRARAHKSTTRTTTTNAVARLAAVPHAQKPTPVPQWLQHSPSALTCPRAVA
jgi:hypothetical protein